MEEKILHELEFLVRDYECDLQGIVNNANYQHYLEHARHEYLVSQGISFSELHDKGIDLIVTKVEIDYKLPLRSRDRFVITTDVQRHGNVRLLFVQSIFLLPDRKPVVHAKVTGVAIRKGRPFSPAEILKQLGLTSE
ncbi:MAG TPA: acyl-CoA thioesterase [Bacteroidales bacterium]|nr:acyl-CoA thioesterase [Bacteroidales bacterium]